MYQNNVFFPLSLLTVNVVWEAKFPAVFGNDTYLQCNISDEASNCSKKTRQWFGGPRHRPLCYNNNCAISDKYKVMEQPNCFYTLMIRNFSELDVNCDYTCSYGVSQKRRNLTLDEHRFICKLHICFLTEMYPMVGMYDLSKYLVIFFISVFVVIGLHLC